ncbi:hypothetical protein AFLA_001891 [Aspergillus flavus NRRL3357]|nr:hypothetical protein AFLA_001891 [Aspergillus flavus NRRL3357]
MGVPTVPTWAVHMIAFEGVEETLLLVNIGASTGADLQEPFSARSFNSSCLVNLLLGGFSMTHWACGVVTVLESDLFATFCSIARRD